MRRRTILLPIRPSPIMPSSICVCLSAYSVKRDPCRMVPKRTIIREQKRSVARRSVGSIEPSGLRLDSIEQIFPGRDKRVRTFTLEVSGELFIVNSGTGERRDYFFGIAAIDRQNVAHGSMIGERKQRLFG